jgi:hypothetical protein
VAGGIDLSSVTGKTGDLVRKELRKSVADRDGHFIQSIVRARGLSASGGDVLDTRMQATFARLTAQRG